MKQIDFSRHYLVLWMVFGNVSVFADGLIIEQSVNNLEKQKRYLEGFLMPIGITNIKLIGELESNGILSILSIA